MSNSLETNGSPDQAKQGTSWQQQCAELIEERDQLRARLAQLEAERAADLKAMYALTQKEFAFTQEDILAQISKEPPLEQIIANLGNHAERPA